MDIGIQLFPTPVEVIEKMLEPYIKHHPNKDTERFKSYKYGLNFDSKYILDPSAGTGALLSYIKENEGNYKANKLFAIEIDPTLNDALKDKYTVIGNDFLDYEGDILFDLILMNPPFSDGDSHLIKAWDILYKGDIVCLLNAETIRNPFTKEREMLASIIEANGSYEFIGTPFSNSENPTDVEVVMVRLHKEVNDKFNFDFDLKGTEDTGTFDEETIKKDEVALNDVLGSTVIQYNQLRESYVDYLRAIDKMRYYSQGLLSEHTRISDIANGALDHWGSKQDSYNDFTSTIKLNAWQVILSRSGLQKYMTTKVSNNFRSFIREKGNTPFTKENIYEVIRMVVSNADNILEQAIADSFDMLTNHYEDNRVPVKTWKHNDAYKVNKKIIIPNYIRLSWDKPADRIRYGATFNLQYGSIVNFDDVDKALCYITGKKIEDITTVTGALKLSFHLIGKVYKAPFPKFVAESTFFMIRFYLAGTVHLTFKDLDLLDQFNMRAARLKNWLPEAEFDTWKKKRRYEEYIDDDHQIPETINTKQQTLF